ncbi:MAG TPA: insulinase family protein, partial [Candidatus Elarobacter sp.]|nr:insulinase family protein [Candidatus Elarobacter sp.]
MSAVPSIDRAAGIVSLGRSRRGASLAAFVAIAMLVGGCRGGFLHRPGARDLSTPPPAGAPAAEFHVPPVTERVLPNGLTVLAVEYHELPLVVFHLLMQGGAAEDPPGKEGLAELTADLIRQGTTRRSAEELAREIEFLGGSVGGDAGYDFSTVSAEFLRKDIDQGF